MGPKLRGAADHLGAGGPTDSAEGRAEPKARPHPTPTITRAAVRTPDEVMRDPVAKHEPRRSQGMGRRHRFTGSSAGGHDVASK
jgi:hypothetical protein